MLCCKLRFINVFAGLISFFLTEGVQAGTVIISAPPPSREIVVGPPGYSRCYIVPQGFYNGVWQHKHQVCEYNGAKMWVNGYWQCGSFRSGGICTNWRWIGSHWANGRDMDFYRRPLQRNVHRHNIRTQNQIHEHMPRHPFHGHENIHGHH